MLNGLPGKQSVIRTQTEPGKIMGKKPASKRRCAAENRQVAVAWSHAAQGNVQGCTVTNCLGSELSTTLVTNTYPALVPRHI